MAGFRFRKRGSGPSQDPHANTTNDDSSASQGDVNHHGNESGGYSPAIIKQATKTRRNATFFACFCYLMVVVFLIVVEVGNTPGGGPRQNIYFFKLDLANIAAQSLPSGGLVLTNSIARTLGLHDFYQVGLWNFCEGYLTDGITNCSKPRAMYWFNPVEILLSELFAGASIALPSEVNDILNILQLASNIMFGCFLAALCLSFVLMLTSPIVVQSRLWSGVFGLISLINALLIIVGAAVGTAMGIIARYALSSQPELNVGAVLGTTMYVLMWIAAGFSVLAFFMHAGMCCCCTSRRDIRTGRRNIKPGTTTAVKGSTGDDYGNEKSSKRVNLPTFHRTKRGEQNNASEAGVTSS